MGHYFISNTRDIERILRTVNNNVFKLILKRDSYFNNKNVWFSQSAATGQCTRDGRRRSMHSDRHQNRCIIPTETRGVGVLSRTRTHTHILYTIMMF